jgi:hypothetical protein
MAILPPTSASNQASVEPHRHSLCQSKRFVAIVHLPEVLGNFGFVGELRPSLIEMVKGLKARWISRRHSVRSPHPHQPSERELNLPAFAKVNSDHLIWNPVGRVQDIPGFRQQDKIANQLACVGRSVAFHHVSECLDGPLGGKTAVPQSKPVEQLVLTRRLPDGYAVRQVRLGGGDNREQGP